MPQNLPHHKPLLVQAPVRALDPDGVTVVSLGTVGFAVATLACWTRLDAMVAAGDDWWFWVAVTGTVIGLLGLGFSLRRRHRRRTGSAPVEE